MSGLRVMATIPTDPAAAEAVRAGLADLAAATLAEEGCEAYEAYESAAEPGLFVTIESWRDQADLDAHMQTAHVAAALEALGDMLTGDIAVHPLSPI